MKICKDDDKEALFIPTVIYDHFIKNYDKIEMSELSKDIVGYIPVYDDFEKAHKHTEGKHDIYMVVSNANENPKKAKMSSRVYEGDD